MSKIIYTDSDGTVSVIHPTKGDVNNAIKDVPSGKSYKIVDDSVVPSDRSFRDAWVQDNETIKEDITKARELHKNRIRDARKPKLESLDIEFQKALETSADTTSIVSKKNALRDAPADSAIGSASDTAALKAQWNTAILGTTPYT